MSNHRWCCCDGCLTDCCSWWACGPSTPKTATLTIVSSITAVCSDGVDRVLEDCTCTVTAAMTRTGTSCATYRYSSPTATIASTARIYGYWNSIGDNCDAPANDCVERHCDDCACGPARVGLCRTTTYTYNQTVNGVGGTANVTPHSHLCPANAALTILCDGNDCLVNCKQPVLVFTPATSCEAGTPAYCFDYTKSISCETVNCCELEIDCGTSGTETGAFQPWELYARPGVSACLDATTFDNPYADDTNTDTMKCFPFMVTGVGIYGSCMVEPLTCAPYIRSEILGTYSFGSDTLCELTDPLDPGQTVGYCTVPPVTAKLRVDVAISWNFA